jgi:hypothetical protein
MVPKAFSLIWCLKHFHYRESITQVFGLLIGEAIKKDHNLSTLACGRNDNPAGTRRNGSHPLPSVARPPDLVVRHITEGGRYIAFPPRIGVQLFPNRHIDAKHDRPSSF